MLYEASLGHHDFPSDMQNYSLQPYNMGATERITTSILKSATTIISDKKETNSDMNRPSDILSQSLAFMNDF